MNRRDILLAVLSASEGRPYTPVQIQKAAFLIARNMPHLITEGPNYNFAPYDYGPFDQDVYNDAECLARSGLAEITQEAGVRWKRYAATDAGVARGRELLATMHPGHNNYICRVSAWVRALSFEQLVKSIYDAYPEMKANSIFRG